MAQQGWQCPKCGNIISPNMMWCPFCSGEKKLTYTTTSTPYKVDTSSVCKIENSSEKPNNCTDCECTDDCTECRKAEHGCKDEPQIGEMMTEEEFNSMLARVLIGKDE